MLFLTDIKEGSNSCTEAAQFVCPKNECPITCAAHLVDAGGPSAALAASAGDRSRDAAGAALHLALVRAPRGHAEAGRI